MSFPNLVPETSQRGNDAAYHTAAIGAAVDGLNTFNTGLNPARGIDSDKVEFIVQPLDAGVTAAVITDEVDPETGDVGITFTGAGQVSILCVQAHSSIW